MCLSLFILIFLLKIKPNVNEICFADEAFYNIWVCADGHLWLCDWIWQPPSRVRLFLFLIMS